MIVELPDGTRTRLAGHMPTRRRRTPPPAAETPAAALAAANVRLATAMVTLMQRQPHWAEAIRLTGFDACVSEAMLILLHCARRYEPARGFQFSTYACKSIRLHLTGFLASYVRRGVIRVPESAPADVIAACQTRLLSAFENCHDRLPAPDATHDTEAVEEARHLVAAAIRRLPTRMRYLAKLRHVRGLTHTQIARRLERTKESVRQRFMRIDPLLARIIRDISTPSDG